MKIKQYLDNDNTFIYENWKNKDLTEFDYKAYHHGNHKLRTDDSIQKQVKAWQYFIQNAVLGR